MLRGSGTTGIQIKDKLWEVLEVWSLLNNEIHWNIEYIRNFGVTYKTKFYKQMYSWKKLQSWMYTQLYICKYIQFGYLILLETQNLI